MKRLSAGSSKAACPAGRVGALLALALVAAATLAPTSAVAAKSMDGFIGGAAGLNAGGLFSGPRDVAVYDADTPDPSDDKIYVVESLNNNSRVQRLDGDGNFELLWGRDTVAAGTAGNTGTGFEVCVAATSGASGCKSAPSGSAEGELKNPTGVAVDQSTGRVYVMDRGNRRVQEFTLDGEFVRAWGWGVDSGADAFEICTSTCQAGSTAGGGQQAGQFADATTSSIGVGGGGSNDVFVTDAGNRRVMQFSSTGAFLRTWGFDVSAAGGATFEACDSSCRAGQLSGGPNDGQFASGWPSQIAVDSGGVVYASDSTDGHRVVRFDSDPAPATPPDATTSLLAPLPSSLLGAGTTTGLEIDPASDDLLVVRDSFDSLTTFMGGLVQQVADPDAELAPGGPPNPSIAATHPFAQTSDSVLGTPMASLGVDPVKGTIYLPIQGIFTPGQPGGSFTGCTASSNTCAGLIVLAEGAGPLDGELDAPADVGTTTVSLVGSVDPGGGAARYRFQVSRDGASWTDVGEARYAIGSGSSDVSVQGTGLQPATLYRVRLLLTKQAGIATTVSATSNESIFLTDAAPPDVTTLGSARRTDTSARLRALVDPNGSATTYRIEYGPAGGSFDHHVPVPDGDAGSGNSPQLLQQDVTGLQPETDYHFRVVATNAVGISTGDAVTFTTRPASLPKPPTNRGYELVSPAEKVAGVGTGIWYHGPAVAGMTGFPAYDAERFAIQGTFGAVLVDGKYSYGNDWALAERTPQGWIHEAVASRRAYGGQTLVFMLPQDSTPDMSLMSWGATTLKLFPEQENWIKEEVGSTVFVRDWPGKWEIFGPTDDEQGGGLAGSVALADDASSAVASGPVRGMTGTGDPTATLPNGVPSVYLDELVGGPSDTFPGTGERSLVNVCTAGTEIPTRVDAGGGSFKIEGGACPAPAPGQSATLISGDRGATLGNDRESVISADGARVFFMSPNPGVVAGPCSGVDTASQCPAQVFVRQRTAGGFVTRWLSKPEVASQDASLLGPAIFEGASRDGDKVFFRTTSPLTADDPNGENVAPPVGGITTGVASPLSWDLYMYDMPDAPGADPADGALTRISGGPNGGDCNSPLPGVTETGALRFASDDGSQLYFTCAAPLSGVPLPDDGTITSPGGTPNTDQATNLYNYDANRPSDARWRFVARLPRNSPVGSCAARGTRSGTPLAPDNEQATSLSEFRTMNCVRGTRDGSFISFMTDGQLTDDDPDAVSGDIYTYDSATDELVRASAMQGGVGGSYPCLLDPVGARCYGDEGIGPPAGEMALPRLGVAEDSSGERVAFFQTRSRLVPEDTDSSYDVYEWRAGTLSLITPGTSGSGDAFFAGNDRTGRNVYFATRDRMTWQDDDAVLDVYTARIGGGIPEPEDTSETCDAPTGECQGPGGGGTIPTPIDSDEPSTGNLPPAQRVSIALGNLSRKARRKAARTGSLELPISVSTPIAVTVRAKARIAGRVRDAAARTRRRVDEVDRIRLRLTKPARRALRAGKAVRITITASSSRSRPATTAVRLKR